MTAHLAVLATVAMSPHNPHAHVLPARVARDFDDYLASRKPLPPHHGLLLDTRAMPFAKGLLGITPTMRVEMDSFGDWRGGRVNWEFDLPSGQLNIELWPLAGEPEQPPNPNRTSRAVLYSRGPAGVHAQRDDAEQAVRNLAEARRMNPDGYPSSKLAEEKDLDKIRETPVFMRFVR